MTTLFYIIIATFIVSLISWVGILTLFLKERVLNRILLVLVAFSAGALLGGAFFHLIPEAILNIEINLVSLVKIFLFLVFGFSSFYILEEFIKWHHHHIHHRHIKERKDCPKVYPFSYLILISDAFHNFIDGLIIAGSFLVSFPTGLISTLAVALHEIPQEIGDFGVLVYGGVKKIKALFLNFLSAASAVLGGIAGFFLFEGIGQLVIFLLPFAAGSFIYIASSDLIPEVKEKSDFKKSIVYFLIFLAGISLMLAMKLL